MDNIKHYFIMFVEDPYKLSCNLYKHIPDPSILKLEAQIGSLHALKCDFEPHISIFSYMWKLTLIIIDFIFKYIV